MQYFYLEVLPLCPLCAHKRVLFSCFTTHLNSCNHSLPILCLPPSPSPLCFHPLHIHLHAISFLWLESHNTPPSFPFRPARKMNFKNFREYLAWLYYQYLLITGIYVLEPWEKSIFNSILFSAIAMVIYTSYVFVPIHVRLALEFFSGIFGGQPESTMALMN